VGKWLKTEGKNSSAMDLVVDRGWGRPPEAANASAPSPIPGADSPQSEDWIKTLERETAEWNRELAQQGIAQNYLNMLAGLRGPRDWLQYANIVRASEGSQLPAWAQALTTGQNIPQFQGAGDGGYQSIWNQPAQNASAALMAGIPQPGATGQQQNPGNAATLNYGAQPTSPGTAALQSQGPSLEQQAGYYPYQPFAPIGTAGASTGYTAPGTTPVTPVNGRGYVAPDNMQAQYQGPLPSQAATYGPYQQVASQGVQGVTGDYVAPGARSGYSVPGDMPVAAAPQAPQQPGMPNWAQQLAKNPQTVRYSQWNNLLPFEQQMLQGTLENEGVDYDTWFQQMAKTWVPRKQVTPVTTWQ
jgi:hypothetical protein